MNTAKTALLMIGLMALFLFIGGAVGGRGGMQAAFVFACLMNLGSYWFSDKIVLAMYRAKPVTPAEAPDLCRIVQGLALRANIPMPKVYLIPSAVPNAFATGRNPQHAAVAVTTGIMDRLNQKELEAVLGHELSHVFHRDILISSIAATLAGAIMMLAHGARWGAMLGGYGGRDRDDRGGLELLFVALFAPIAASLIQLAISRSREYEADKAGAELTGQPLALASALQKISDDNRRAPVPLATSPATAHLFIANPLRGEGLMALFSTHPSTAERVRRLEAMALEGSSLKSPRLIY
jgi:heat shock protein HtpX